MKNQLAIAGILLGFASAPAADAQVTIDVTKITCDQYLLFKVADPRDIAIWLSGYYHGKRGTTLVDEQALQSNEAKLKTYCIGHLDVTLMQAVETLLAPGK